MPTVISKTQSLGNLQVELKSAIPILIIASIVGIVFAIIMITIALNVYPMMHPNSYQNVQPTPPAQIVHDHTVYNNLSQDNTVATYR